MIVLVPGKSISAKASRTEAMPNSSRIVFSEEIDDVEHLSTLAF